MTDGRARLPDETGHLAAPDGVRIAYEVFGSGEPTILLLPSAPIIHSRQWKGQVPYLSRRHRVVTYDGRGNGASDRPTAPEAFRDDCYVSDVATVMDGTGTDRAVLVGLCTDAVWRAIRYAVQQPERVLGIVAFAVGVPRLTPSHPHYIAAGATFNDELPAYDGWGKYNRNYWVEHYEDFLDFFFSQCLTEPHSTKPHEDTVGWGLETDGPTLVATQLAPRFRGEADVRALLSRIDCPILVIHGSDDHVRPCASGARLAELGNGALAVLEGSGHLLHARDPVKVNLLLHDFIARFGGNAA